MNEIAAEIKKQNENLCRLLGNKLLGAEIVFLSGYHPVLLIFKDVNLLLWFYESDRLVLKWEIPEECQKTPYEYSDIEELTEIQNALDEVIGSTLTEINLIEYSQNSKIMNESWNVSALEFIFGSKKLQVYESGDETSAKGSCVLHPNERRKRLCI